MHIVVPRPLLEKAQRKGIDVEDVVVRALSKALGLDPRGEAETHIELAERFL